MTFVLNHAELQPINGEVFTGSSSNIQDGARLDIVANGFWGGQFECTFFDVQGLFFFVIFLFVYKTLCHIDKGYM